MRNAGADDKRVKLFPWPVVPIADGAMRQGGIRFVIIMRKHSHTSRMQRRHGSHARTGETEDPDCLT
jgi:hypothetical protein